MPSIISAGLTGGTALNLSGDTSGVLQIQTNGSTAAMTIDTSQNVGIGTSSPSARLDIGSGNLNFSSTGQRITGDFSNATVANRVMFQTSTTNSATTVSVIPNGTSQIAGFNVFNNSDPTNSSLGGFSIPNGIEVRLAASATGTGTNLPLTMYTGGSERLRIDTSGNVGIGTSSPLSKVDVVGTGNYDGSLRVRSTGTNTPQAVLGVDAVASAAGYVGTLNNLPFQIRTNDTERMRIDSSGNLLVGTTQSTWASYPSKFVVNANSDSAWLGVFNNTGSGTGTSIGFLRSGTQVGSIVIGSSSTSYNTSSDYRLKENIAPMTGALATVSALKPVTYTWKSDGSTGQGFIAHELQAVVPDCVTGEKDAVDEEGNPKYQGIDTSFLVATLTAAIQELKAELDTVKTELATLKGN